MPHHKFKLGQSVQYVPDKLQATTPAGSYKITRLLPSAGRDLQYRIKNASEPSRPDLRSIGAAGSSRFIRGGDPGGFGQPAIVRFGEGGWHA